MKYVITRGGSYVYIGPDGDSIWAAAIYEGRAPENFDVMKAAESLCDQMNATMPTRYVTNDAAVYTEDGKFVCHCVSEKHAQRIVEALNKGIE